MNRITATARFQQLNLFNNNKRLAFKLQAITQESRSDQCSLEFISKHCALVAWVAQWFIDRVLFMGSIVVVKDICLFHSIFFVFIPDILVRWQPQNYYNKQENQ